VQRIPRRAILNEARLRKHLVRNVDPLHGASGQCSLLDRFRDNVGGRVALQRDFVGQLPIAGADIAWSLDRSILDAERSDVRPEPVGRLLQKNAAHLGADVAKRSAGLLN
jgi:hypothetical protein